MPADDEAEAVAVLLPAPEAARAVPALWEAGEAVVPLDPSAPEAELRRSLATLRPTALLDRDGRHSRPDGVPVAAGVAAVVTTSGTTGERKGVELTFAGLAASGSAVAAALGGAPETGWLCCLPVHLVAGLAVVGRAWATGRSADRPGSASIPPPWPRRAGRATRGLRVARADDVAPVARPRARRPRPASLTSSSAAVPSTPPC